MQDESQAAESLSVEIPRAYYAVHNLLKYAEEDDYLRGCASATGRCSLVELTFRADTVDDLIERVRAFVDCDADAVTRNACDEAGRVDFVVYENGDGVPPSERERVLWRDGLEKMYCVTYTAHIARVTTGFAV